MDPPPGPIHRRSISPAKTTLQYNEPSMKDAKLVLAAGRGDHAAVSRLLREGANVNTRCPPPLGVLNNGKAEVINVSDDGYMEVLINNMSEKLLSSDLSKTALQAAAGGGHEDVVRLLLDAKADVNAPPAGSFGRTALQAAAGGGHEYVAALLIKAGANVNEAPGKLYGRTALQAAAEGGHGKVVVLLILEKASINASPAENNGRTALQAAVDGGNERIVKLLLSAGANVNASPADESGRTALQAAVEGGYIAIVKLLIRAGANVNAPRAKRNGRTALQAAVEGSHADILELLKRANAFEKEEGMESTLNDRLILAAQMGNSTEVRQLLAEGADVTARSPPYEIFNNGRAEVRPIAKSADMLEVLSDGWYMEAEKQSFARTALQAAADGGHEEVVKLLLGAGADVNALPADESGRTALQAAAEGGYTSMVKLLISEKANVDAPRAKRNGRTALQAAVEGLHADVLLLLIAADASENEEGIELTNDDRLILAAGQGDYETVDRLLRCGADMTARCLPPLAKYFTRKPKSTGFTNYGDQLPKLPDRWSKYEKFGYFARTALQAAAEGGHKEVVALLVNKGADVNALPGENFGRTALQAAAEGGHEDVVAFLIDHKANINASPAIRGGKTALRAAAGGWHEDVLKLLIGAGVNVNKQNHSGQIILHEACKTGDVSGVIMLLGLNGLNAHAKDHFGSTPLHIAVAENQKSVTRYLIKKKRVDMDIKNNSGKTPLRIALEKGFRDILDFLIQEGASTDDLEVAKLSDLLRTGSTSDKHSTIILQKGQIPSRFVKQIDPRSTEIHDLSEWGMAVPSIHLFSSTLGQGNSHKNSHSFVDPRVYLRNYSFPDSDQSAATVVWAWLTFGDMRDATPGYSPKFQKGIPTNAEARSLKPADVMLVSYICFNIFTHSPVIVASGSEMKSEKQLELEATLDVPLDQELPKPFQMKVTKLEISWIMIELHKNSNSSGAPVFRSLKYRGTLRMKYLSIPRHGVEFFKIFLDDIHKSWLELFEMIRKHLATVREAQLKNHGKEPYLTQCLLEDSREWSKLRTELQCHISEAKDLLNTFKTSDILYSELVDSGYGDEGKKVNLKKGGWKTGDLVSPVTENDMRKEKLRSNGEDTNAASPVASSVQNDEPSAITELSEKIKVIENVCEKEMSYLEEQTMQMIELEFNLVSIYEARRSIGMSVSMKRLSWITFIFLPLTFVSGLFGMNVNVLKSDPTWVWYLVFAISTLALVMLGWILFKYIAISKWVERKIGSRLKSLSVKSGFTHSPSGRIRRRLKSQRIDEEQGVGSITSNLGATEDRSRSYE